MNEKYANKTKEKFEEIYSDYYPRVYRYMYYRIGEFEAEDLTQEVFIKVLKSINKFREKSKLSTWIYCISKNTVIDRIRHMSFINRYNKHIDKLLIYDNVMEFAENDIWSGEKKQSVIHDLLKKEKIKHIQNHIEKLPVTYKSVLKLSEYEGLTYKEIARKLNISLELVKIRHHRARKKLRKEMEMNSYFSES